MRGVGGDIGKERFVFVGLDEFHAFVKPDIGAVTGETPVLAVDDIGIVKIVVAPIIRGLADSAGFVVDGVLESAVFRAEGIAVAEMPFAEQAGGITVCAKISAIVVSRRRSILRP